MAETKMVNKIMEDAQIEAESIVSKAQHSAELTLKKQKELAQENAKKEIPLILENAKKEAERLRMQALTSAKIRATWMITSEKNKLLNEVLNEVKRRLEKLTSSREQYLPILNELVRRAALTLNGGGLEILLNSRDSTLQLDLRSVSKAIKKEIGVETSFRTKGDLQTIGGFIMRTVDGKIVVDSTFESFIERLKKVPLLKVSKILFSD